LKLKKMTDLNTKVGGRKILSYSSMKLLILPNSSSQCPKCSLITTMEVHERLRTFTLFYQFFEEHNWIGGRRTHLRDLENGPAKEITSSLQFGSCWKGASWKPLDLGQTYPWVVSLGMPHPKFLWPIQLQNNIGLA